MATHRSDNRELFKRSLNAYANRIGSELIRMIEDVAEKMVSAIDGDEFAIPIYTGNLKAATGVAVYADGMMKRYIPTAAADRLQSSGFGGRNVYKIDGREYLLSAIAEASSSFSMGIWIVLFSAVPYAYHIDAAGSPIGRGQNFFGRTVQDMVAKVFMGLRPIAKEGSLPLAM